MSRRGSCRVRDSLRLLSTTTTGFVANSANAPVATWRMGRAPVSTKKHRRSRCASVHWRIRAVLFSPLSAARQSPRPGGEGARTERRAATEARPRPDRLRSMSTCPRQACGHVRAEACPPARTALRPLTSTVSLLDPVCPLYG
jgi:hypothetical protein